ncbi:MAG: iron uptake porin [Elainellaceae cyanobacterium]
MSTRFDMTFRVLQNSLLFSFFVFYSFALPGIAQPDANADAIAPEESNSSFLSEDSEINPSSTQRPLSESESQSAPNVHHDSMDQLTSVTQLSDVQPTDWAFQALQSLVERYGCIVGYPDSTYRGNRALSRYEFAAGVNACLDRVNEIIAQGLADTVTRDDLETLQRLQEEFAAELATLRGRVDALEARTAELEANQFSTTTKLSGEAIFAVSDRFGDDDDNQTVFQNRVRLNLVTSFTGNDALHTRLATGNNPPFGAPSAFSLDPQPAGEFDLTPDGAPGTAAGVLTPRVGGNTDNDIELDWLAYYFPLGDRLGAYVAATGSTHNHYVYSTVNPFFEDFDGGSGSISAFSQASPIYRIGGGTGVGFNVAIDPASRFVFSAGYLAENAADSSPGEGLFNGDYAALGQLTLTPTPSLQFGLTYVHGYHTDSSAIFDSGIAGEFFTGSTLANAFHVSAGIPAVTNSYGIGASWQITPNVVVNAFGGYTDVIFVDEGDGEVWYYGLGLALPDLLGEGNLGGIFVGVEPYLGGIEGIGGLPNATSLHAEAFYKFRITDNISITPGIIWVTNPDQINDVDGFSDYVVGTLRTTFRF